MMEIVQWAIIVLLILWNLSIVSAANRAFRVFAHEIRELKRNRRS